MLKSGGLSAAENYTEAVLLSLRAQEATP